MAELLTELDGFRRLGIRGRPAPGPEVQFGDIAEGVGEGREWRSTPESSLPRLLPEPIPLVLLADDTQINKTDRKIAGVGVYEDPVRSNAGSWSSPWGLSLVVIGIRVPLPRSPAPPALPISVRLHTTGVARRLRSWQRWWARSWPGCRPSGLPDRRWRLLTLVGDGAGRAGDHQDPKQSRHL